MFSLWVRKLRFPLRGLELVWNTLLTRDRIQVLLCGKQTKAHNVPKTQQRSTEGQIRNGRPDQEGTASIYKSGQSRQKVQQILTWMEKQCCIDRSCSARAAVFRRQPSEATLIGETRQRYVHLSFKILGGVLWSFVDDLVDIRHVPGGRGERKHEKQVLNKAP